MNLKVTPPMYMWFLLVYVFCMACSTDSDSQPKPTKPTQASLAGVWMSYKVSLDGTPTGFGDVKWIVFDEAGNMIDDLPRYGLHVLTADELKNYAIGTYTIDGKTVKAETPYRKYSFEWTDENTLSQPDRTYAFHRCVVKNNLRLQGSWTTFVTIDDPWLDQPGVRYVISFNNDGTFTDRGLFVFNTDEPDRYPENRPGTGTYQIVDYTIILSYADGHVKNLSFTGTVGKNPSENDAILFIRNGPVFKR